jgi:myo-inositol 2-dehydrogenase/D-chiro-inositol 1-dehydrogenase
VNVKAGIVGLGFMGRRYAEFLHKLDGVEVTAVCDIRQEIAAECAEMTGARIFLEAEDLATSPDVDAVFVCTPEDKHVAVSLTAINAGKAVMIEKPLAHSLEAARSIVEAASSKAVIGMVGHLLRFEPRWAAAKRVIAAGDIGEVVSIATRRVGNVLDQSVLGGRTTIPLYYGVHDLDIVRWFANAEATSIFASRRSGALRQLGYAIDDLYCAVLEFENNILATAELGWHVPAIAVAAPTAGITVVGTQGCIKVEQADTGLQFWSESGRSAVHPVIDVTFWPEVHRVPGGALANELSHFLECVRKDSPPIITLDDAYEALRLSLAMEASADRKRVVQLSEFE